ncbi:Calcitonin receptor [Pseudolycoriella hygida]|uniref:Calcitonin receptor n=1 Tax=Pseudolycoriella hygida TaxID=35572 RepID=A0A9Q0MRZ4_9DIPT|nr:Calcitonin receptor [Pseudolycoriella hygida]
MNVLPKICRYRESPYPESIFSIFASWGCYGYTRSDMFVGGVIRKTDCLVESEVNQGNYMVPGILVNESCIPFRHTTKEIISKVMTSFQNEVIVQRWINCTEDALHCCRDVLHVYHDEENTCSPTWDAWSCFDRAAVGLTVKKPCSMYSYIAQPPRCIHYSYKQCFLNGTWDSHTDYSTCSIVPRMIARTNWHTATLSISIIVATPAIVLLFFYRGHQVRKITLIRNLIIAIVLRNTLVLASKQVVYMDELTQKGETIMSRNNWPCKMLAFFEKLAKNVVIASMLLEGIFLHQLLTNVFATRGQFIPAMFLYSITVYGASIIAAVSWAIVMTISADEFCWMVTEGNYFDWINDAPRLIMLTICNVLLIHLMFNIWFVFKNQNHVQNSAIRTAKAFILCLPLFGCPFLFLIFRPDTDSCIDEQVYYFFSYALEGLQGVAIAIIHCYIDREILKYYSPIFRRVSARFNVPYKPRSPHTSETFADKNVDFQGMLPFQL